MGQKHLVFDETLLLWDADATLLAAATYYSADLDFDALGITGRMEKHWGVAIDWRGITSAGAPVTSLVLCSAATATPTAVISALPTVRTLAQTIALYETAEAYIVPIPMVHTLQYFRIGIIIGTAAITAGVITAGILPLTG